MEDSRNTDHGRIRRGDGKGVIHDEALSIIGGPSLSKSS